MLTVEMFKLCWFRFNLSFTNNSSLQELKFSKGFPSKAYVFNVFIIVRGSS